MTSYAVCSQLFWRNKNVNKGYTKYLVRLVKIMQSATLDKLQRENVLSFFFFWGGGRIFKASWLFIKIYLTSRFIVRWFFDMELYLSCQFLYSAFLTFVQIAIALHKEQNFCSLLEVPSGLHLVRRRRPSLSAALPRELQNQVWQCLSICMTPLAPAASPKMHLTPGQAGLCVPAPFSLDLSSG